MTVTYLKYFKDIDKLMYLTCKNARTSLSGLSVVSWQQDMLLAKVNFKMVFLISTGYLLLNIEKIAKRLINICK